MEIQIDKHDKFCVVHLAGRWDAYSSADFESTCQELIQGGMKDIILNLRDVDYISSLGLRGLLTLGKILDPLGGTIVLCALCPQIHKIFVGSGFSSLFKDYPDVAAARAALQQKA